MVAHFLSKTRDPTDPILDTGFLIMCHMHRARREVEVMSHNGSQNNETSCSST